MDNIFSLNYMLHVEFKIVSAEMCSASGVKYDQQKSLY